MSWWDYVPNNRRRRLPTEEDDYKTPPVELPDIEQPRPTPLAGPPGYVPPAIYRTPSFNPAEPPSRQQQYQAEVIDPARRAAEGPRWKTALLSAAGGALRGLGGGGLGGAIGGAIGGGITGAVNPRGFQEQRFRAQALPRLQERWALEDQDRLAQRQADNDALNDQYRQAQMANLGAETDLRLSQAAAARLPRPVKGPTPEWKLGTNRRTGQRGYYNAADEKQAADYDPYVEEKGYAPHWVETDKGYVNLNAPGVDPSKVRKLQRPKAAREAKPKEDIPTIPLSEVRRIAEQEGVSVDRVKARLISKRIKVVQ